MRRHLAAARVGVIGCADRGEQLLGRRHAQAETERPVAIVGVEPVVARTENLGGRGQDRLVAGTGDLEEDPVLPLELNLPVVDAPGEQDQAVDVEEIGLGEDSGGLRRVTGTGGHATKMEAQRRWDKAEERLRECEDVRMCRCEGCETVFAVQSSTHPNIRTSEHPSIP